MRVAPHRPLNRSIDAPAGALPPPGEHAFDAAETHGTIPHPDLVCSSQGRDGGRLIGLRFALLQTPVTPSGWNGMQDVDELFQRLPDAGVRDELVATFQPLARHIARRYANRGEELADLRQVANIGLIKAIDRYDPRQGRFANFAIPTISGELKRHFRDNVWALGVPRRLKDQAAASRRSHDELRRVLGRSPTADEVASHVGVPEQVILDLRSVGNAFRPDSLDALQRTGDTALVDRLGDCDVSVAQFDDLQAVNAILASMTERDRRILFLRFHCEMAQVAIADEVGISQMEVSRTLRRSMREIRGRLQEAEEETRRPLAVS